MEIEVKVSEEIAEVLKEIAELKNCSAQAAAVIVLERYAKRAKNQIESAHKAADNIMKK